MVNSKVLKWLVVQLITVHGSRSKARLSLGVLNHLNLLEVKSPYFVLGSVQTSSSFVKPDNSDLAKSTWTSSYFLFVWFYCKLNAPRLRADKQLTSVSSIQHYS